MHRNLPQFSICKKPLSTSRLKRTLREGVRFEKRRVAVAKLRLVVAACEQLISVADSMCCAHECLERAESSTAFRPPRRGILEKRPVYPCRGGLAAQEPDVVDVSLAILLDGATFTFRVMCPFSFAQIVFTYQLHEKTSRFVLRKQRKTARFFRMILSQLICSAIATQDKPAKFCVHCLPHQAGR